VRCGYCEEEEVRCTAVPPVQVLGPTERRDVKNYNIFFLVFYGRSIVKNKNREKNEKNEK